MTTTPFTGDPIGAAAVQAPQLSGRRVRLSAVTQADYDPLYRMFTDSESGWRLRYRGATPSPTSFATDLWNDVLVQMCVRPHTIPDGQTAVGGLVQAYGYSPQGHCRIATWGPAPLWETGILTEATILFIDFLLTNWPLRKIYLEMLDFTYESIRSGADQFFAVQGVLTEHEFVDGSYRDLMILAIDRATWDTAARPFVEKIKSA